MSQNVTSTFLNPALVYTLIGTFLGFLLFAIWDAIKDHKLEESEKKQVLSLLATEATENLSRVADIRSMLKSELEAIGARVIDSPVNLASDSWTIAKSRNIIKAVGEKLQSWISVYQMLSRINNTLANRDRYRATSSGMTGYVPSIKQFDSAIINALDDFKRLVEVALDTLPADVKPPQELTTP